MIILCGWASALALASLAGSHSVLSDCTLISRFDISASGIGFDLNTIRVVSGFNPQNKSEPVVKALKCTRIRQKPLEPPKLWGVGGALVESTPVVRRVMGSTPALAAT